MITLEPGTLFCKRYEILGLVGAGGMGAVYRACDPHRRDFVVALKILYPGVIRNADARKRFKNEIIASYRVDHENVIRAYEYFDEPQFQAYAMEFVAGGDLAERMQAGGIAPSTCLNLLCQLANGLDVIHRAGIVHRDIKPENILISEGDIAKIGDFGVARLKDRNSVTQEGAMVGTPRYVSPEYVETG